MQDTFLKKGSVRIIPGSVWSKLKTVVPGDSGETWDEIWEESPMIETLRKCGGVFVNDAFIPLWDKVKGLMFLDGGYGSSKTTYAITRLLCKCRENKYFKCFYGRQKKIEARQLHKNIIREIKRNNWTHEFDFSEKPNGTTEILHIATGNLFELFGCDDDESLKGIDNPTDILVDEINQISFASFGMLFSRLRTPGVKLQLIGCFNNCDVYPDHWLVKYIYGNEESTDKKDLVVLNALKKVNIIKHHSVYTDNHFQNPEAYVQTLYLKAGGDELRIAQYLEGAWGVKLNAQPYYKMFRRHKHVGTCSYDPTLPVWVAWDENVNPYLPCLLIQVSGNEIRVIHEITARNPNNELRWVCDYICEKLKGHIAGMYICGDATSKKDDVKLEKGKDFFTLAMDYLSVFNPVLKVPDSNPNNAMRGNFINLVLKDNYGGLSIIFDESCETTIEDFENCPEDPSGKGKLKEKSKVEGVKGVQKYGHLGDCFDYFICEEFSSIYLLFQNGGRSYPVTGGGRVVNNTMEPKLEKRLAPEDSESDYQSINSYSLIRFSRNRMN